MTCEITDARICHVCKLVTADDHCPLCGRQTRQHKDAKQPDPIQYCGDCGGEFTASEVVVKTWNDDPYEQTEDGMLITVCRWCQAKVIEETDE